MANIANLAVVLSARTSVFSKKMKGAQAITSRFATNIAQLGRKVAQFGAVAASVAGVALIALTKRSLAAIDVIAKLSDRIGVSTEFLSAFGHAAAIAGTSAEEFNKSMEMFVRRMGEAKQGSGEALRGMESLGLKIEELIQMSPEDSFLKVAEGIRGLGTQAEKSAVAYQFFGRTGSKMLNLLESDTSNVIAEAERLGITFSRLDAAKVEQANDAIARLKATFVGLGNAIAIQVAPFLEAAVDRLADFVANADKMRLVADGIKAVAKAAAFLIDVFNGIRSAVNAIIGGFQKLIAVVLKGINAISGVGGDLAKEFDTAANINLQQSLDQFLSIGDASDNVDKFFADVQKKAEETAIVVGKSMGAAPAIAAETATKDTGQARSIRSRFISVSGLGQKSPMLQKAQENIDIQKRQLAALLAIEKGAQPSLL